MTDTSGGIARRFGVVGMPTAVFVDAAGRIIWRKHGFDDALVAEIGQHFGIAPANAN